MWVVGVARYLWIYVCCQHREDDKSVQMSQKWSDAHIVRRQRAITTDPTQDVGGMFSYRTYPCLPCFVFAYHFPGRVFGRLLMSTTDCVLRFVFVRVELRTAAANGSSKRISVWFPLIVCHFGKRQVDLRNGKCYGVRRRARWLLRSSCLCCGHRLRFFRWHFRGSTVLFVLSSGSLD